MGRRPGREAGPPGAQPPLLRGGPGEPQEGDPPLPLAPGPRSGVALLGGRDRGAQRRQRRSLESPAFGGGVGGSSRSWPGHMYEGAGVGQFGASVSYPRGPPTPGQAAVCVALRLCLRGSGSPEDAMLGQPGDTEHAPPWPTCPAPAGNTGLSQDAEGSLAQGGSLCWGLVSLSDPHLRREVAGMASLPGGVCTQAAPEQQASRCSPGGGRSRRWAGPRAGGPFPH